VAPLAQGLSLALMFLTILWSSGSEAAVECQSYDDPEYTEVFPGYQCPEGFYPI